MASQRLKLAQLRIVPGAPETPGGGTVDIGLILILILILRRMRTKRRLRGRSAREMELTWLVAVVEDAAGFGADEFAGCEEGWFGDSGGFGRPD